jgi:hypothetical protein
MAVQTLSSNLLRSILRVDALFEVALGAFSLFGVGVLSSLVGLDAAILTFIGVILILAGVLIYIFTDLRPLTRNFAMFMIVANAATAVVIVLVLALNVLPLTTTGQWVFFTVADVVAVFAVLEYVGIRRLRA